MNLKTKTKDQGNLPYRYLGLDKDPKKPKYVCLDVNPFLLFFVLLTKGEPLGNGKDTREAFYRKLIMLIRLMARIVYRRFLSRDRRHTLQFFTFGHLCLKVHNGYKFFNLTANTVTKVFSTSVTSHTAAREIELLTQIGNFDFIPKLLAWNLTEGWYIEEYINGHSPDCSDWSRFLKSYNTVVAPLIEKMILATPPESIPTMEYARHLAGVIYRQHRKLSKTHVDANKVKFIRTFISFSMRELQSHETDPVFLVFSHGGGATPRHIIVNEMRSIILDWEGSGRRSVLHDLFDNFFERIWKKPVFPDMRKEMAKAIQTLQHQLFAKSVGIYQEVGQTLYLSRKYLLIYYLERMWSYVAPMRDMTQADLDRVLRITDAFARYEASDNADFRLKVFRHRIARN